MTKDEIFAAMEKAYTGAGSAVEGSFAGDLLRACAELWSTEIDGLEERAFVASAAGEWRRRASWTKSAPLARTRRCSRRSKSR